ncbi:MAG TPA: hypothetical protein VEY70_03625, partial [Metabacillus sp.]|nr:hypothetical protein [Metabacillus sp.]
KNGTLELRLPWLMLNVKDPSQKEIMGDVWSKKGLESSKTIESISLKIGVTDKEQTLVELLPSKGEWVTYTWDNWEEPVYHERLKKSYYYLQETFKQSQK